MPHSSSDQIGFSFSFAFACPKTFKSLVASFSFVDDIRKCVCNGRQHLPIVIHTLTGKKMNLFIKDINVDDKCGMDYSVTLF